MPDVLVVEDSPIDCALIEGILKKNSRMTTRTAANGAEALAQIAEALPDVVVTDLQMPELDGLQLVTAMRIHYPHTPVVLVTAHGSEELAVEALEQGAASYVPKSQLGTRLLEAVDQVLALASVDRSYEALSQCMEYAEFRYRLGCDLAALDRLVEFVQQIVSSMGVCDAGSQLRLGMALEEALRSALLRGCLELGAEQLLETAGHHNESCQPRLQERYQSAPFCGRQLLVHVRLAPEEAQIDIRHDGAPIWKQAPAAAAENPALEDPADRSLILMRAFLDDVQFDDSGQRVTLRKRRAESPPRRSADPLQ